MEVSILTADSRRILAVFYKMIGYPSVELIEGKSDPIPELRNMYPWNLLRKSVFV